MLQRHRCRTNNTPTLLFATCRARTATPSGAPPLSAPPVCGETGGRCGRVAAGAHLPVTQLTVEGLFVLKNAAAMIVGRPGRRRRRRSSAADRYNPAGGPCSCYPCGTPAG